MSMFAANYRQTDPQIARTPDIGAGTVHKHVEHQTSVGRTAG
jgi:hypothetical protein